MYNKKRFFTGEHEFFLQSVPKHEEIFLQKIFYNEKSKKNFYNNLVIRRVIMCFTVSLMV